MPTTYYNDLVRYPKAFAYIIEESIATKDTLKIICFRQLIVKETSSFQYLIFFLAKSEGASRISRTC